MEGLVDEFYNMCANEDECEKRAPGNINLNSTDNITMFREDEPFLDLFHLEATSMLQPFVTSQNIFNIDDDFCAASDLEIKPDIVINNAELKEPISKRKNSQLRLDVGLQTVQSTSREDILNTPEVVKTLTEQESNFNLLSYVFEDKKSDHITEASITKNSNVESPSSQYSRKRRSSNSSASVQTDDDDYPKHKRPNEDNSSDDKYRQLRDRNNEASRKSRATRKAKENELNNSASQMEVINKKLTAKAEELENMVITMRQALLQIMTKKKENNV